MSNTNRLATRKTLKREFPDAYFVANVGWCGPQWEAAAARETELKGQRCHFGECGAPRCTGCGATLKGTV